MAPREEEEISGLQEDDRDQFSDQLASVGVLGRTAAGHCVPLLTRYLAPAEQVLCGCASRRARGLSRDAPKPPHTAASGQKQPATCPACVLEPRRPA